ncbi:spore germination protein GerW family protein [Nocardia sp. NPDC051030]|uniref:GerW family sporulation protein n=1 Tax=Nocardia sp. NPDC051030 TaxID=3155162 RepID=UPI0034499B56
MTQQISENTGLGKELAEAGPENSATLLGRMAERLGWNASVQKAFGEPIVSAGVTVIPVARVGYAFGGGTGSELSTEKTVGGGGGGGGLEVRPVGFIEIRDGKSTYRPIRNPWVDAAIPLVALMAGTLAPRAFRRWMQVRRSRID